MKRKNIIVLSSLAAIAAVFTILILSSCNANFTAMDPNAGSTFSMRFSPPSAGGALPLSMGFNPLFNGESQVSGVYSVKYYITNIRLAGTADESGSGLNNIKEPYYISWQNHNQFGFQSSTSSYTTAMGKADTANYIDLMSDSDLAKLSVSMPVIVQNEGQYNYAVISGTSVIKIKAMVNIGSTNLYTKANAVETVGSINGNTWYNYSVPDLRVPPAEEMVVHFNGDANWAKLLKPFTISDEDLRNHVKYKLFLAFDPAGYMIGYDNSAFNGSPNLGNWTVRDSTANSNTLSIAWMDVAPVVYKEGQHVVRSTYVYSNVTAVNTTNSTNRVNLEVFTVQEDITGAVYAVIDRSFSSFSNAVMPANGIVKITTVATENGKLAFYQPTQTGKQYFISGFTPLSTVGASSTLTYYNPGAVSGITYTLAERVVVAQ